MDVLRTPEERFQGLEDFPFAPKYLEVTSSESGPLRMHYVDEGSGPVVLLLHGEPSWSYLYRKMIRPLVGAGLRAVAPDLIGFGRSDKPSIRTEYSFQRHVDWMRSFIAALDLRDITLFGQDWGGLIGLRLVAEETDRFARVVAANTFLPTGDQPMPEAFHNWRKFVQEVEAFDIGRSVQRGCVDELPPEVVSAYNAPFPDESYKEGARQFPTLVPASPDDPATPANRAAWEVLSRFDKPFLTAFGDSDPITRGGDLLMQAIVPGAANQPHVTLEGAGHFIQEDKGEEMAGIIIDLIERTPS